MSIGAVSLNMVWNPAIKGSSFLQASIKGIHTYATKVTKANLLQATKFGILNKNVKTLDNHLTKLSAKASFISKNPIKINVNRTELMETRKDLNAIERSAKRASFFTSKIKTPRQKPQQHAATSTVVGAVTVATIMTLPFKSSIEFESSMARVKALSGATNQEFKSLNNTALKLGAATEWSASQVADGMQFLSQAGFKTNETISAMPSLLSLATAGATDLATTADIASNIMGGFDLKATDTVDGLLAMQYTADTMAKVITSANVDVQMLGETMKYVAPDARKAGLSLQETAAMAGLLGNIGIQASQSGTAMRTMVSRLSAPPTEAKKALQALGIETKDSVGNLKRLPILLAEVSKATKGLGSADQIGYMSKIFGLEAKTASSKLIDFAGDGRLSKYFDEIEKNYKGSAKKIAEIQLATTAGQFKILGSAMEGLSISATTGLLPTIRTITQGFTSVAGSVATFTKDFPNASKWVFGLGTAFILGSVALAGFGFMAGAVGSGLALLSSPITLIVGGIMAVGAAGYYLYNKFDGFKTSINGLFGGISDVVMPLAGAFKNAFVGIGSSIMQIARPIGGLLMAIGGLFGGFKTLGMIAKGVGWVIGGVFTAITTPILTVVELIRTAIGSVALIVDGVASFLGFGDEPKKATDTKIKTITKPANNTDYKTTLSTTKKEEQSFFSKWFSFGSDENEKTVDKTITQVQPVTNNIVNHTSKTATNQSLTTVSTDAVNSPTFKENLVIDNSKSLISNQTTNENAVVAPVTTKSIVNSNLETPTINKSITSTAVNNSNIKDTTVSTKKEEQSFFSKWFSFGSDKSTASTTNVKTINSPANNVKCSSIDIVNNSNTSGVIAKPNYTVPPSFNEVTNKYDSSSTGGNSQKTVSQTFNFNGGITITATDGKIDEQGFRTQIEQILRDIQSEQQDTQLRDIA